MGRISNIVDFNRNRQEMMKIKTATDEVILFTHDEAKNALRRYMDEELNLFSSDITRQNKIELMDLINAKMKQIENALLEHINNKVDNLTEKIMEASLSRKINEEVEKRVEEKIEKIKKLL